MGHDVTKSGTLDDRPEPGREGRAYVVTSPAADRGTYVDTGEGWVRLAGGLRHDVVTIDHTDLTGGQADVYQLQDGEWLLAAWVEIVVGFDETFDDAAAAGGLFSPGAVATGLSLSDVGQGDVATASAAIDGFVSNVAGSDPLAFASTALPFVAAADADGGQIILDLSDGNSPVADGNGTQGQAKCHLVIAS